VSALEEAALDYAQQGLHVFPLQPRGKTPLTAHGLEDATIDLMTIETWWARWPEANVAIRTGELLVVDEDRLGALDELAAEAHETIPVTGLVKTASGKHYYFRQPVEQRIRNTAGKLAPGIDTRGEGGYVVAPPSIHPSGSVYEWLAHVDAVVLPAWIAQRLIRSQPERKPMPDLNLFGTTAYGKAALDEEISNVALAAEGTRNDSLNRAAFALGQLVAGGEVDQSDAWRSLQAAADSAGLPTVEAGKTIRSGFQAGLEDPRKAPESDRFTAAQIAKSLSVPLRLVDGGDPLAEAEAERDSWVPVNLNDLPETPPVKPDLGDTHLVYPGKRHVFSGPPESAKTLAAYCILIQVARTGGMGILIDFEMGGYDARKRLHELGASREEIDRILYIEPEVPANAERIRRLVAFNPQLIVIDASAGVYSLEGLDDNKRLDVEKVSTLYVKAFWRNSIASILIDHVVKDNESRGRYAIGSERKLGGADVHLGFDVVVPISRGTAGKYKITTHKDRGGFLKRGHLADLALNSDPTTHNITWGFSEAVVTKDDKGHFRPTIKMEEISKELAGEEEPVSKTEVKRRVGGNADMCGKALDALIKEGHLTVTSGPRGADLLTLTRPYDRASDPKENPENQASGATPSDLFSSRSGMGDQLTPSTPSPPYGGREEVEGLSTRGENDDPFQGWLNEEGTLTEPVQGPPPTDDLDWT
jgi:putative DNA primase/helicase